MTRIAIHAKVGGLFLGYDDVTSQERDDVVEYAHFLQGYHGQELTILNRDTGEVYL